MKKEKHSKNDTTSDQMLNQLNQKIDELTSGWQRTQADFINYKKQVVEEKTRFCHTANANLLYELLPILDNFQLAAKHVPTELIENNWVQGIKQIEKQLENTLFSIGLEKIEVEDRLFNPESHEAVETVKSELPEGTVVEEVQTGYRYDGEVLRPSKVKISAGS